jgi:hypothetical protein
MYNETFLCVVFSLHSMHCEDLFGGKKHVQEVGSYTSKKNI